MDHTWYFSAVHKDTLIISLLSLIEDNSINSYLNDIRHLLKKTNTRNYRLYDIKQNKNEIVITFYFEDKSDFENFYKDCLIYDTV